METKRLCVICGLPLSMYNSSIQCFHHAEKEEEQFEFAKKAHAHIEGKQARIEEKQTILPKNVGLVASVPASIEGIVQVVAVAYDLPREVLFVRNRTPQVAFARQIAMFLARADLGLSFPHIARFFQRDHTTVMHACEKVAEMVEKDALLNEVIGKIRASYSEKRETA